MNSITITHKAKAGDRVLITNFRTKSHQKEPGVVYAVEVTLGAFGTHLDRPVIAYEVLLDRRKKKGFPLRCTCLESESLEVIETFK